MKVEKVINNNIVRSLNEHAQEVLVVGKGLGFKKQVGDPIDQERIEKVYRIEEAATLNHLEQIMERIPLEHVQITNEIVEYAKISLAKPLPENIYTTLMDHISFALQRAHEGVEIRNALLWEIRRFYNHEFLIGQEAVSLINKRFDVNLPIDEAGFIALHFASADLQSTGTAEKIMTTIQDVLNIVRYHFNMELDDASVHYERFITHLKFFTHRVFSGITLKSDEHEFVAMVKTQYANEYACA